MLNENDTRNQILDVAEELFYSQGYEETSMAAIQERVGIARGTLYYHFSTKEEILDEVVCRQGESYFADAKLISLDKRIPVADRIIQTLLSMSASSQRENMRNEEVHHPTNALLHQKINYYIVAEAGPFLTDLVREGISEGVFQTEFPEFVVEMILIYANVAFDYTQNDSPEKMKEKAGGFIYNIHRLLGAKQGTLDFSALLG